MRVALITGCYGSYDPVRPLPEWHGFDDAVCVTDTPEVVGEGWRLDHKPSNEEPRLAAKRPKMMPWLYTDCDAAVWMDASFEIVGEGFSDWTRSHLSFNDFVVWMHPEGRTDIRQEVDVCWSFPKYERYPLREQLAHYVDLGMPRHWGLFAAGTVGWVFNEETRGLGERWFQEQVEWSIQDQISLPFLLWDTGKKFGVWQANEYQNPYLHLRWDERPRPTE